MIRGKLSNRQNLFVRESVVYVESALRVIAFGIMIWVNIDMSSVMYYLLFPLQMFYIMLCMGMRPVEMDFYTFLIGFLTLKIAMSVQSFVYHITNTDSTNNTYNENWGLGFYLGHWMVQDIYYLLHCLFGMKLEPVKDRPSPVPYYAKSVRLNQTPLSLRSRRNGRRESELKSLAEEEEHEEEEQEREEADEEEEDL